MNKAVRIRSMVPPGHVRTPYYLRGKQGVIEREVGEFGNPEGLAYGHQLSKQKLYRVRFTMAEIWGENAETPTDTLDAEIYEHWIERLD